MRIESWVGAAVVVLVLLSGSVIADEPQQCHRSPLPPNIDLAHDLARVLARIYDRSPAFRSQCARIAATDTVRVTVRIDTAIPSRCRAYTIIRRQGHEIRAEVHLPPSSALTELVAHEFEHILEQIDGVDLRHEAAEGRAWALPGGVFETRRAFAAGMQVLREADPPRGQPAKTVVHATR